MCKSRSDTQRWLVATEEAEIGGWVRGDWARRGGEKEEASLGATAVGRGEAGRRYGGGAQSAEVTGCDSGGWGRGPADQTQCWLVAWRPALDCYSAFGSTGFTCPATIAVPGLAP